MVASMVASLPVPVHGFTQVPNSVLLNTSLSKNARFLYSILMQHGRASSGYSVFPSYARLCLLMSVSEPTARKAMLELRTAGLVVQKRRGQGRSNRYFLMVRPKESCPLERNAGWAKEDEDEEHQEVSLEISRAKHQEVVSLDTREVTEEPQAPSRSPAPTHLVDEARMQIFPYIKDISREMHDESSLTATTTRAVRIFHRSNVSIDQFQGHLLMARQRTQEKSASIKKQYKDGTKAKVPYFFAVLEKSLGLDGAQSSSFLAWPYPESPSMTAYSAAHQATSGGFGSGSFGYHRE